MTTSTTATMTYRNLTTGEIAPAHLLGTDEGGRPVYSAQPGWEPVGAYTTDEDGNWQPATPAERADAIAVKAGGEWAEELLAECHTAEERAGAIASANVEGLKRLAFDSLRDDLEAVGLRAEWDAREDDLVETMCEATVAAMREAV